MGAGPRNAIPAPPARPPRVGLLAAAEVVEDQSLRWENGFSFTPEVCSGGGVVDPCSVGSRTPPTNPGEVATEPFGVWTGDRCSSFGFDARDYRGRAERLLAACESKHIAREFWRGEQADSSAWENVELASPASDVLTAGSAVTPLVAMSLLEQGLGQCSCGVRGMIHASRNVVTHWASQNLLRREGNQILTIHDTIVVADAGYDGSGPNGEAAADGSVWAYATGPVRVFLGPVEVYPETFEAAVDRSNNNVTFWADRLAAVAWDRCCHLAVQINVDVPDVGS